MGASMFHFTYALLRKTYESQWIKLVTLGILLLQACSSADRVKPNNGSE